MSEPSDPDAATTESAEMLRLRAKLEHAEELLVVHENVAVQLVERHNEVVRQLTRSEANFRALVERSPDSVFVHRQWVIQYVNPAMAALLGYDDPAQLVGHDVFAGVIHPEDRAPVLDFRRRAEAGEAMGSLDARWVRRDGASVAVRAFSTSIPFDGEPAVLVLARDITEKLRLEAERERAEGALRLSEERHRVLFELSPLPIIVFDPESLRILAINEASVRLYGYRREELLSMRIADLKVPEEIPELVEGMSSLLNDAERPIAHGHGSFRGTRKHRKKDGTLLDIEVAAHAVMVDGRPTMLAIGTDVTETLRLEEQLSQSRKMDAIGQLAGGIAHDFNNLLSVILSYAGILLEDMTPGDSMRVDVEEVKRAGERARDLTGQLLAFSRKQLLEPRPVDLNQILAGMEKMLGRLLGDDFELSLVCAHKLGTVYADPTQIEQVIMNLVVNARDAAPNGGSVSVETQNVELDATHVANHPGVTPGRYVMMAVTDTGIGMDAATKARIFEPFFTTKEAGKGTGLGLSTVFGIVRQSGGHIDVRSEPGVWTTFRVYLPRTDRVVHMISSLPPSPAILGGSETILLVEDDEQVRAVARAILRRQGYNVLDAQNGGEAFLICEKFASTIHLLLTDVVMPRMSGPEVVGRLGPMRPEMKVLYMSGHIDSSIVQHGVLDSGAAFLQKPLTPEHLARKVREVLSASEGDEPGPRAG